MVKTEKEKNKSIPELTELESLKDVMIESSSQISKDMITVRNDLDSIVGLNNTNLNSLEQSVIGFIANELKNRGLIQNVEATNRSIKEHLEKIKFFSNNTSLVTGFFSTGFSKEDEENWSAIENALDDVYHPVNGVLKQIQDYFLYNIDTKQITKLLNKPNITLEEELFVRSILVKGYLVNFRELMLPFHALEDDIFIKFKKDRIKTLQSKVWKVGDNYNGRILIKDNPEDSEIIGTFHWKKDAKEIKDLTREINLLESQILTETKQIKKSRTMISDISNSITAYAGSQSTNSVVSGTLGTGRYLVSAVGHASNSGILKSIGNLGGFFGSWLPGVSAAINAGTQMNNNRIVFNYEKKLRWLSLIDNTKRSLFTLEQEFTDYFINSVLMSLNKALIDKQIQAHKVINRAYEVQLASSSKDVVEAQVEAVKKQYYQAANGIIDEMKKKSDSDLKEKDVRHQEEIKEKVAELAELDQQIVQMRNELATERKVWEREKIEQQKENIRLKEENAKVEENYSISKSLYEQKQKAYELQEKALKEQSSGDLNVARQNAFLATLEENTGLHILINQSIAQKNEIEAELNTLKAKQSQADSEIKSRINDLEIQNQRLSTERADFKRAKENSENERRKLSIEYDQVFNERSTLRATAVALEEFRDELIREKDAEIEKCNRLRQEKVLLGKRLQEARTDAEGFVELQLAHGKLQEEYDATDKDNQTLNKMKVVLQEKVTSLEEKFKESQSRFMELDKKSGREKVKLMSVLAVDTARNYLPEKIPFLGWNVHKTINNFETMLFASELTNTGTAITWGIWGGGLGITFLIGLIKLIIWLKSGTVGFVKLFSKFFHKNQTNKHVGEIVEQIKESLTTDSKEIPVSTINRSEIAKSRPRVGGKFVKSKK